MLELLPETDEWLILEHLGNEEVVGAEETQKFREIGGLPFAAQKGFGNADVSAFQDTLGEVVIIDDHFRRRARSEATEFEGAAIGKTDEKCAILDARCERECVADKKGQTGAMFGNCRSDKPDWRSRGIRLTQSLTAHHSAYLHARLFITPLLFFKSVTETDRNRRFGTLYHPKTFEP